MVKGSIEYINITYCKLLKLCTEPVTRFDRSYQYNVGDRYLMLEI